MILDQSSIATAIHNLFASWPLPSAPFGQIDHPLAAMMPPAASKEVPVPVSGIVIRIDPAHRDAIIHYLANLPEIELQPTPSGEQLVAVLDTADFQAEEALVQRITAVEGVGHVAVAYHNFEDMVPEG